MKMLLTAATLSLATTGSALALDTATLPERAQESPIATESRYDATVGSETDPDLDMMPTFSIDRMPGRAAESRAPSYIDTPNVDSAALPARAMER